MATDIIFLTLLSGCTVVIGHATDVVLWPLSIAACPPGQKMTLESGCDDHNADAAGKPGRLIAMLCCILSAGLIGWRVDLLAALLFCVACSVLSLGVGAWWAWADGDTPKFKSDAAAA
jgi:hypothetical protein